VDKILGVGRGVLDIYMPRRSKYKVRFYSKLETNTIK
jgi:hypothetical protein